MKIFRLLIISSSFLVLYRFLFRPIEPYFKTIINQNSPQLIIVLGGDVDREKIGFKLSKDLNLPILITSGSNLEYSDWLAKKEGVPSYLITRDYRAKDTFSNFTSIVDNLANNEVNHAFLITSKDHLNRAISVGNIIAGSRGIRLTSISIPCNSKCNEESKSKYYVDVLRGAVWVISGKDLKVILKNYLKVD